MSLIVVRRGEKGRPTAKDLQSAAFSSGPVVAARTEARRSWLVGFVGCGESRERCKVGQPRRFDGRRGGFGLDVSKRLRPTTPTSPHLMNPPPAVRPFVHSSDPVAQYLRSLVARSGVDARYGALLGATRKARRVGSVLVLCVVVVLVVVAVVFSRDMKR